MLNSRITRAVTADSSGAAPKRWTRLALTLLILTAVMAGAMKADNIAFMGTISGDFGTIDLNTGVFTKLGNSGVQLAGMAVANGMLYGSSYHTATGTLYTINPANGSLTVVGTSSLNYDDFGSTASGLYAVGLDANLYSINATSGAATLIGPTGLSLGTWRCLSTNSSTLYFANGANLYTLDTNTGAATLVGSMGGPQMGALLLEGGILYGGENSPSLSVATLDTGTGAATTVAGVTGTASSFFALAPYPVPAALVTLDPSTTPSSGDPGVTSLTVVGHGFPSGSIPPANVTVTLNPTTVGGGTSGTTTALAVTVISGSTESVTFQIPGTISVSTPVPYQVSIAGATSTNAAFQSGNTAALTINPTLAIITSSPLPSGTVGVNYSQALTATGGSGSYAWSLIAGALPGGLSLNAATGVISGQPNTASTSNFTVQVTDGLQGVATMAFALTVNLPPLVITTSSPLPTGTVKVNYSQTLAATGGSGSYVWAVSAGTLPAGLSLNTSTGLISGLPTTGGTSNFTIQVTDSTQTTATKPFALTIDPALVITTSSPLPDGTVGVSYSQTLAATGGSGSYTWALTMGALPAGLSLNSTTGQISGTPTAAGFQQCLIVVTDSFQATASKSFGLTIKSAARITTVSPNRGRAGQTLQVTITGSHTHFVQGSTKATFGAGISVGGAAAGQPGPVTVSSPTGATAHLAISSTAAQGSRTVTVTTGAEHASLVNGFTIFPAAPTLTVLREFAGSDGSNPYGSLLIGSGRGRQPLIYGTTESGGTGSLCPNKCGTVFSLTAPASPGGAWTEAVLYRFTGGSDGSHPFAGVMMDSHGVLYGTTASGGSGRCTVSGYPSGCGTVFSLTPPSSPEGAWNERVLHNFTGGGDGALPIAGVVIDSHGVLYGTTFAGGSGPCTGQNIAGCGIVFSLTPPASPGGEWTEAVLHSFTGGLDGANPRFAGVAIGSGGVLYGTTYDGGGGPCTSIGPGCGIVFSLTPPASPGSPWIESVLHRFPGASDGANPSAGVAIGSDGVLYGTTGGSGNGTVFMLKPPEAPGDSWMETTLHNFTGSDGQGPWAGVVIGTGGVLYGTTIFGGSGRSFGTVFMLTPPGTSGGLWTEAVLYNFTDFAAYPIAPVVIDNTGMLYGAATTGGSGHGNLFSLTP